MIRKFTIFLNKHLENYPAAGIRSHQTRVFMTLKKPEEPQNMLLLNSISLWIYSIITYLTRSQLFSWENIEVINYSFTKSTRQ